jgi:hypothetical protein
VFVEEAQLRVREPVLEEWVQVGAEHLAQMVVQLFLVAPVNRHLHRVGREA